ncbi:glycosyltransferase family 4 protein [Rathayibacter tanaceti]|uniref:Glycosyltransferase n=2 Tax=Rathayibacter tanaceti TaxID=1671680 RepID=A0A162GJ31_9MICO|nr:glycosyltransferase family 1 protein [Rathayibacter tanaceti]KZX22009.1 D-inositol-3-phosphate glycosyltransferase [Rathayibacter tanaceti]QHC56013.1 glycosyltransferase [Rathayibacter tanaceti]TCO39141.1 glycosyl transferase family 1 [Rathayibacter tanaceti]
MNDLDLAGRDARRAFVVQRLEQIAPFVLEDPAASADLADRGPGPFLDEIARAVQRRDSDDLTWLSLAAFLGVYPVPHLFSWFKRSLQLAQPHEAMRVFMVAGTRASTGYHDLSTTLSVVTDAVVVDVDFCARNSHATGIQRVVRQTMKRWHRDHDLILTAWEHGSMALRRLGAGELERVIDFETSSARPWEQGRPDRVEFVVPFRSTVVIPEVPTVGICDPLAALAQFSGNTVSVIGYDAIPVVSADTVPPQESLRFVNYLTVVKHATRVAGISAAATQEFEGFTAALPAQGLEGPELSTVSLPVESPPLTTEATPEKDDLPLVLSVGSHEPRKNHLATLFAAEMLWREGKKFRLRFIGGGNPWATQVFDVRIREAQRRGRPVEIVRGASDDVLVSSYRNARFFVFASTHEGYGLPVAEALALGLPTITSDRGSLAEIAADGGCLTVDPYDDDQLLAAMRELLDSDERLAELAAQARSRPKRTWNDYSAELWEALVPSRAGRDEEDDDA